jgi:hypothetical protein
MMPDSDAVLVALTGAVLSAPAGTAGPVDPTTAWAAAWINLGWISEDGVTESYSDDSNEIKAWQGGTTVRTVITGSTATYQFTAIETNKEVLARYHKGSTVTADVGNTFSTIEIASAQADSRAWGFDVVDGVNHIRIILERAEVTERGILLGTGQWDEIMRSEAVLDDTMLAALLKAYLGHVGVELPE